MTGRAVCSFLKRVWARFRSMDSLCFILNGIALNAVVLVTKNAAKSPKAMGCFVRSVFRAIIRTVMPIAAYFVAKNWANGMHAAPKLSVKVTDKVFLSLDQRVESCEFQPSIEHLSMGGLS